MNTPAPSYFTDAELAALWSRQALEQGRYELGLALAKIAAQAYRVESDKISPTRPEPLPVQPLPVAPAPANGGRHLYGVPAAGPTGNGDQDLARETRDLITATLAATAPGERPEGRRCEAKIVRDGIADVCRHAVYWAPMAMGWFHVDGLLDRDHDPVVPLDEVPPGR